MISLLGHNIVSSVKEFVNYHLLKDCIAYTNRTVSLYNYTESKFTGLYAYGSPYAGFVYNSAVTGAVIASGIYNPAFVTQGSNGLIIDYKNGRFLSTGIQTGTLTANVSVPDINTYVTTYPDSRIIGETNFLTVPDYQGATGYLSPYSNVLSALFFRSFYTQNEELAFGGLDWTSYKIRIVAVMKNNFHLNAAADIVRDMKGRTVPLLTDSQIPLNIYGDLKSGWNYSSILSNPSNYGFIDEANFGFVENDLFAAKNPSLSIGMGTVEVRIPRTPRTEYP